MIMFCDEAEMWRIYIADLTCQLALLKVETKNKMKQEHSESVELRKGGYR